MYYDARYPRTAWTQCRAIGEVRGKGDYPGDQGDAKWTCVSNKLAQQIGTHIGIAWKADTSMALMEQQSFSYLNGEPRFHDGSEYGRHVYTRLDDA